MSVSIGKELPEAAVAMLDGSQAHEQVGKIALLLTVDDDGFPHVALLSPGEVLACGKSEVRLALYGSGKTIENIASRSRLTLAILEPGLCCYVKGSGVVMEAEVPPGPIQPFAARRVDVEIEDVLLDSEVGAAVETGPRYSRSISRGEELEQWNRVWGVLRSG